MTRPGNELAANSSLPCPKGENRGRMAALEAAWDGYRLLLWSSDVPATI